jgi:hypothetical protein
MRLHMSAHTEMKLAPRSLHLLHSITNEVRVTVYYDKNEPLFSTIMDLLKEYHAANPRLHIQTVDYLLDTGLAEKVLAEYKDKLGAPSNKNLIIFDCAGRVRVVSGDLLADYTVEQLAEDKDGEFQRRPVAFKGEMIFSSALLAVSNPKPLKAYFLTGHQEGSIFSDDPQAGYRKLAGVLQQNFVQVDTLDLIPTNMPAVPADCNLLVIAGPVNTLLDAEVEKIDHYLTQGGRLLVLFSFQNREPDDIRLERLLARWGVEVTSAIIHDPQHTLGGQDVIVGNFGKNPHPIVNPLQLSQLQLALPRPVGRLRTRTPAPDAPKVEEIAFTGPMAFSEDAPRRPQTFSLAAAVEKGAVNGVITERGTTRIVVIGDSLFLNNGTIDHLSNRDFAASAVNWLLDRTALLQGVGPKPVNDYRLVMTRTQLQKVEWVLLGALPGSVLLIGGMVWLRRRR